VSVKQNKVTLQRIFDEVINKGDMSVIPELIAPSWSYQTPLGDEFKGTEGFKQFATMWRTALPDLKMTVDEVVGEGDTLAARCTMRGTFKGKLGKIEPTGKKLNMTFAYFYAYKNGKEAGPPKGFMDMLTFFQQLGIKPPVG